MNKAKRSLSQNFLTDRHVLASIGQMLPSMKGRIIAEIGPGQGSVTALIEKKHPLEVHLIEKDDRLANEMKIAFPHFDTIHADILDYVFTEDTIIGAIPYSISRDILKKMMQFNCIEYIYLIVQKEFAEKIVCRKIKTLPLFVNTFFDSSILMNINHSAFTPVPKVDSSMLFLKRKRLAFDQMNNYWTFLNNISTNKRKMISNVLPIEDNRRICHMKTEEIYNIYVDINIHTH